MGFFLWSAHRYWKEPELAVLAVKRNSRSIAAGVGWTWSCAFPVRCPYAVEFEVDMGTRALCLQITGYCGRHILVGVVARTRASKSDPWPWLPRCPRPRTPWNENKVDRLMSALADFLAQERLGQTGVITLLMEASDFLSVQHRGSLAPGHLVSGNTLLSVSFMEQLS
jgi:hypothetical protein